MIKEFHIKTITEENKKSEHEKASNFNLDSEKYICMQDFCFKYFFYDNTIRVPDIDISKIKPLSKRYCEVLWIQYVSEKK